MRVVAGAEQLGIVVLRSDARCSACGDPIAWRHTQNSKGTRKAFPCNIEDDPVKGNVLVAGEIATVLRPAQVTGARAAGHELYTSHFQSCPRAADFRKKAPKR